MNTFFKILFFVASAIYPIIVFTFLVVFKVPTKIFSLFIVFIGLIYLLLATSSKKEFSVKKNSKLFISAGLLLTAGLICLITGKTIFIKLYPKLFYFA